MAKSSKRSAINAKKLAKKAAMLRGGEESSYAKKKKYLTKNGGWGWQYEAPKPWKGAA